MKQKCTSVSNASINAKFHFIFDKYLHTVTQKHTSTSTYAKYLYTLHIPSHLHIMTQKYTSVTQE